VGFSTITVTSWALLCSLIRYIQPYVERIGDAAKALLAWHNIGFAAVILTCTFGVRDNEEKEKRNRKRGGLPCVFAHRGSVQPFCRDLPERPLLDCLEAAQDGSLRG
jgi:hypothetical protein